MTQANWHQTSFLGGEVSPYIQGRIDQPWYKQALATCQNFIPYEEGCLARRQGFKFTGYSHKGKYARKFNFPFSGDAPYAVELSYDGSSSYLRFWRNDEIVTDSSKTVSSFSSATPSVVTTTTNHGWSTGDTVIFYCSTSTNAANGGLLLNRVFTITSTASDKFSIADSVTGSSIVGTQIVKDGTITVGRVKVVSMPYTSTTEVFQVRPVVVNNQDTVNNTSSLLLLHFAHKPELIEVLTYPALPSYATFSVTTQSFVGPWLGYQEGGAATISAASGSATFDYNTGAGLINGGNGFGSDDVGRNIRIFSEPAQWDNSTAYSQGDQVTTGTFPDSEYWTCVAANTGSQPDAYPTLWLPAPGLGQYTYAQITAVTDTNTCTVTVEGADVAYSSNVVFWEMDYFSAWWGYPYVGAVHDGRLWLAGVSSIESRVDGSESNSLFSFQPSASDGTVGDANAISFTINAAPPSNISWMLSDVKGLLIGTQRHEHILYAPADNALTPTNRKIDKISHHGGGLYYDPVLCGGTVLFADRTQARVMEMIPDTISGKHTCRVVNERARHLGTGTIERLAVQDSVLPVVWYYDAAGALYGFDYRRVGFYPTSPPDLLAFHKHVHGTTWLWKDICVGTNTDFMTDTLYTVMYDGTYYLNEILTPYFDTEHSATYGCFLDSSPRLITGRDASLDAGSAGITFYGLNHLNGKSVTVFIAGLNFGTQTVSGGSVTVSYAADPEGLGTAAYLVAATGAHSFGTDVTVDINSGGAHQVVLPVVIGCAYDSIAQTVRPNDVQGAQLKQGPGLAETRRVHMVGMLLRETGAFSVGTSSTVTYSARLTASDDTTAKGASSMFSGVYWDEVESDPGYDGQLYWKASGPYPMTVMSLTSFLDTAER